MAESWRRTGSEEVYDARIFKLRRDRYEHAGHPVHPFYVLEANAWVNIVAVTESREIVLVRQFRHGIREVSLEVPGGMVDPLDADPAAAAARELREETGFEAPRLEPLAVVSSNPAILTNRTHLYLAENARRAGDPAPDPHEDVTVELCSMGDVRRRIESGEIHHSLCVCALTLYLLRVGEA